MPLQDIAIDVRVDAPFGNEGAGFTYDDRAGNPITPAPDPGQIAGTSSDDTKLTITPLSGGRAHVQRGPNVAVGDVVVLTLSVLNGVTTDDARITATVIAGIPGMVSADGVTFAELAAPPAP